MTCLQDTQLERILTEGAHSDAAAWTAHLDECPNCQNRLEQLSGAATWVHDSRVPDAKIDPQKLNSLYELVAPAHVGSPLPLMQHDGLIDDSVAALLVPSSDANELGTFDGFRVLKILGQGGMGVVFQAIEPVLERVVAIKVLAPQLAASETARKRFLYEARAVAKIEHPNVVGIYQVAQHNGLPYIVMPCIDGESLDVILRHQKKVNHERVVAIAVQACEALEAAHLVGIVHRDIKPGNLLIETATDNVKVTDFGLARAINDESLTRTGFIAGTPQYMSPEQAQGHHVDHRSDLYSLAAVMYVMLAGRPPFAAADALATIHQVVHNDPPSLTETANSTTPAWLVTLIDQTLAKTPGDRPQSAALLKQCLMAQSVASLPDSSGRVGTAQQKLEHQTSSPMFGNPQQLFAVACFALVLAGAWFGAQWLGTRRADRSAIRVAESAWPVCVLTSAEGTTVEFDSLHSAVAEAVSGCVIQVQSDLPQSLPIPAADVSLEIHGVVKDGGRPVPVTISDSWVIGGNVVLSNMALRFAEEARGTAKLTESDSLFIVDQGQLRLSGCRVIHRGTCLAIQSGPGCVIEDSLLASLGTSSAIVFGEGNRNSLIVKNSIVSGQTAFAMSASRASQGSGITLRDSTIYSDNVFRLTAAGPSGIRSNPWQVEARGNVFQARFLHVADGLEITGIPLLESRSQMQLRDHIRWRGDRNLFALSEGFVGFNLPRRGFVAGRSGFSDLAAWRDFSNAEGDASDIAATGVLQVVRRPGDLGFADIVPSAFALSTDESARRFGAELPGDE